MQSVDASDAVLPGLRQSWSLGLEPQAMGGSALGRARTSGHDGSGTGAGRERGESVARAWERGESVTGAWRERGGSVARAWRERDGRARYAPGQDENGLTALMLASASGKAEVVAALVGAGAKADAVNQAKGTALHEAAAIASLPIVEALVGAQADVNAANDKGYP
jgi:hypothetical protein